MEGYVTLKKVIVTVTLKNSIMLQISFLKKVIITITSTSESEFKS